MFTVNLLTVASNDVSASVPKTLAIKKSTQPGINYKASHKIHPKSDQLID